MRQWLMQQRLGLAVGITVTLVIAAVHAVGWTAPLEWPLHDWMVRHFSRVPASSQILHVDIDDDALERFGRWPWSRDVQGDLIRILHELGAKRIVSDIVWSEPSGSEIRVPELAADSDPATASRALGQISAENLVYPDLELAAALAQSGAVYVSFYHQTGDEPELRVLQSPLGRRMVDELCRDFSLDLHGLAARLAQQATAIEPLLPAAKQAAARQLVASRLNTSPLPTEQQVHEALLKTPFNRLTKDGTDIRDAYVRELGIRNLRRAAAVPESLRGRIPHVPAVNPPIYQATAGEVRPGFVNFAADTDGIVRRIPLLVEWDGLLLEQLGFAAACDELGIRPTDLSIDDSRHLRIQRTDQPPLSIQLDDHDCMMIDWHVAGRTWERCFDHLPVMRIVRIHEARQRFAENTRFREVLLAQAMHAVKDDNAFAQYRDKLNRSIALRRTVRMAELQGRSDAPNTHEIRQEIAKLQTELEQEHALGIKLITDTWADLAQESNPADPAIAADYQRFREANRILTEQIPELDTTNARINAEEQSLLAEMRPTVADRVCFLGYTATAEADMVHTPPHERMPGVLIHSQVFNQLIQGRFESYAGKLARFSVILLTGLSVTLVSTTRGPRTSLLFALALMTLLLIGNALGPFARWDYWLPVLTAVLTAFLVWAFVVMVRLLVTDRQRRRFSKAVSQYVSPAMARQINETAASPSFAPQHAVVSCLFSDLAGFTTLSEQLGPAGTRAVLNPYLEAMSAVLHHHQALINKFMGDGIFAFFNPPILPCPAHEAASCEAALSSQQALAELIARQANTPLAADFRRLRMRLGIASGSVFVGDFGSETKLDYTCVGDVVNLAARLESANKQFGTSIMVSGPTRDAAGERFCCRWLGVLQVKGQTRGVRVYELLGRRGEVSDEALAYADRFGVAVEAFCRREWVRAAECFDICQRCRPQDPAITRYLPLLRQYQIAPPDNDWVGALELTEK